ncbi:MAG: hypothetical protein NTZ32_00835 [Planctomycetales bacterium]|nr:hypothetical protein [Planctomycetales bacterium]
MTPPTDLRDDTGQRIVLGNRLGAGGEAEVFEFAHDSGRVAKIYLTPTDQTKVGKLHAMVADPHKELRQYCAWPMSNLRDQNNKLVGFVMPRIPPAFREIHELFSPLDRLQHFPQVGFNFLVHAAINLVSAVDAVHEAGHVIGDVNQKNVLVNPQAFVRLVDADSFQIFVRGRTFHCPVGVDEFTPPELQQATFANVPRLPNHDRFGLAILVFQLLMCGRHPYSGRHLKAEHDASIAANIRRHQYAFGRGARAQGIEPPSQSLSPHGFLPAEIIELFERAFSLTPTHGNRPHASEWHAALSRFQAAVKPCRTHPLHLYWMQSATCPWCRLRDHTGNDFFPDPGETIEIPKQEFVTALGALESLCQRTIKSFSPQTLVVIPNPVVVQLPKPVPPYLALEKPSPPTLPRFVDTLPPTAPNPRIWTDELAPALPILPQRFETEPPSAPTFPASPIARVLTPLEQLRRPVLKWLPARTSQAKVIESLVFMLGLLPVVGIIYGLSVGTLGAVASRLMAVVPYAVAILLLLGLQVDRIVRSLYQYSSRLRTWRERQADRLARRHRNEKVLHDKFNDAHTKWSQDCETLQREYEIALEHWEASESLQRLDWEHACLRLRQVYEAKLAEWKVVQWRRQTEREAEGRLLRLMHQEALATWRAAEEQRRQLWRRACEPLERGHAKAVAHWADEEARRIKLYESRAMAYRQEVSRFREERARRQRICDDCTTKLDQRRMEWEALVATFHTMRATITAETPVIQEVWQQTRDEFEAVERASLQQSQTGQQLALLRQSRIADYKIPQIGNKRLERLASHGIFTAADIVESRLGTVDLLTSDAIFHLLAWRRIREREMLSKLPKQPRPAEAARHLRPIAARAQQLVIQLRDCVNKMQSHLDDLGQRLPQIEADWQKAHDANVRASAELAQCPNVGSI